MFIPCISSGQEGYKINGGVFDLETNSPVPYASIINLDDASGTTSEIIGQSITEISGKILNAETGEPVVFASIISHENHNIGTTSDRDGNFKININDSLNHIKWQISAIGYSDTTLNFSLKDSLLHIYLEPSSHQLKEVEITGTHLRRDSIGSRNYSLWTNRKGEISGFGSPAAGWSQGAYVKPSRSHRGAILTTINLFITDQGPLGSQFLIRILIPKNKLSPNRQEEASNFYDHLDKNITFRTEKRGWNEIDLSDENIVLPEEPFVLLFTPVDEGEKFKWGGGDMYGSTIGYYEDVRVRRREGIYTIVNFPEKLAYAGRPSRQPSLAIVMNLLVKPGLIRQLFF